MRSRSTLKNIITLLLLFIFCGPAIGQDEQEETKYEYRAFQFTFLFPPFSTNGINNMNCINDFSLSPFIGYSGGVGVFEAAGFINIDRYTVTGIQLAGFGNTVGAYANGVQVAGFYNVVGGSMNGVQAAGFINVVGGGVKGLQAAGFMNIGGGTLDGVQAAGFMNIAFSVKDSYTVEIVSMDGRQMLITDIHTPIYQLDISCFDKGIYFLTVRSKDNVITRKIVKL